MEQKRKFIITLTCIFAAIVLSLVSYLVYFIKSDTLPPPPDIALKGNLFVAKTEKDIATLKQTEGVWTCKKRYDEITLSLKEDQINNFIDNQQYNSLDKNLNYTFIEQWIVFCNAYFEQSAWDNNDYIGEVVAEIKRKGFVEYNTLNWNTLSGFENAISCYNGMISCTNHINAINKSLPEKIPSYDEFSQIGTKIKNLSSTNYKTNSNVLNGLTGSYNNLNGRLPDMLKKIIDGYNCSFVAAHDDDSSSDDQKEKAKIKADKQYKEMVKWKDTYSNLNEILKLFKLNIDGRIQ
jgi:hypothetical protein